MEEYVIDWSGEAIRMALLLGGPVLAVAMVVGLVVGLGQTLTQMSEPSVGQVARLVGVSAAVLAGLPWMIARWVAYAVETFSSIPDRF